MDSDTSPPPMVPATPPPLSGRSKLELLHRDMIADCEQLLARMEQLAARQEEAALSFQRLPTAVRDAGRQAAALAAQDARRSLLESTRALAAACSDVRIAARAATATFPRVARHVAPLYALAAAAGGTLGGVIVALILQV